MNMSWWPALGAVVLLALIAAIADGRGRLRRGARRPGGRPRGRTRPPGRTERPRGGPEHTPRPGEIWWAEVPYEDGPGSKDRPCLVLSVRDGAARVAKITSKRHEDRPGVIALPPGAVGDPQGRASFLETDELRDVAVRGFRRRVGVVDPGVWDQVRRFG
ncbi:PemK-like, MazF-like toxin of type II toxin-antitoxin system [Streptomyces sp. 136MFCol5.1]|uniref:type II toxin-antitoxin system PemK/MazF family toxin n=1 Tax=Streptomyces sp. 136MFCol5.1 TaxID=1172182 RepID=UPI0008913774|nr:type II toxin-antitoxin system PemK/MazF family toxin [Streptomyces sp. 136MFCol5.1]SCZ06878.1 PemK-like, MazF-like toxin of type II toxin-antitoxin system [Streptomyces sp. 136MFCol5.1]